MVELICSNQLPVVYIPMTESCSSQRQYEVQLLWSNDSTFQASQSLISEKPWCCLTSGLHVNSGWMNQATPIGFAGCTCSGPCMILSMLSLYLSLFWVFLQDLVQMQFSWKKHKQPQNTTYSSSCRKALKVASCNNLNNYLQWPSSERQSWERKAFALFPHAYADRKYEFSL